MSNTNVNTTSTTTSSSEVTLTENRPRIVTMIQNDSVTYESSGSSLKMFASFVSEKGEDNKIKSVTSVSEYIKKYGEPNLAKYGQEGYNIINWLNGGGEVLCLRVLPDNAGYAHATLNIQTKVGSKEVLDKNGSLVSFDDVFLRPTVTFTNSNNTSESTLETELNTSKEGATIDGYKNHLLFTVYPSGRGEYYNNLGFRLTLNTQYDDTYDFRMYNFEVIEFDTSGNADIKEGPFYVSFNPDALSSSNESLYIEDVLNTYCNSLKCICNAEEFVKLARIINPDVNPYIIDPIFYQTRLNDDIRESFYSSKTLKYEDVHIGIHKYDVNGEVVTDTEGEPVVNTIDTTDIIEQAIVIADNTYRQDTFARYKSTIDNMKEIFNSISSNTFLTLVDELLLTLDGETLDGGILKNNALLLEGYLKDVKNLVEIFNNSLLDSDFQKLVNKCKSVSTLVETMVKDCSKLLDYHKSIQTDSFTVETESLINQAIDLNNLQDVLDMRAVGRKEILNELSNQVLELKANGDVDDKTNALPSILSELRIQIDYLSNVIKDYQFSDTELKQLINDYNVCITKYNAMSDPYMTQTAIENLLSEIYQTLSPMINSAYNICAVTICDLDLNIIDKIINSSLLPAIYKLALLCYQNKSIYSDKVSTSAGINELTATVRKNMENASINLEAMSTLLYVTQLQNYNNICRLTNGTDGDLSTDTTKVSTKTRSKVVRQLLVKAYTGLIDEDLLNKRTCTFSFILDANYDLDVKNAIASLAKDIRRDFLFMADVGFQATPEQTLTWRKQNFPVSSNYIAIYGHHFIIYDTYNAKDIKVTMPYFLSSKIPDVATGYGLQYPMAGNKRGVISGFKGINFIPNDSYAEKLYNNRINYCLTDDKRTKLMSQLTSASSRTPLSDINNVIMLLQIKRNVELLCEDYQFEFEDDDTMKNMQYAINSYLETYIDNRSCDEISATVYASDYDKTQHILRVSITIKFKNIVEVVVVTLDIVNS